MNFDKDKILDALSVISKICKEVDGICSDCPFKTYDSCCAIMDTEPQLWKLNTEGKVSWQAFEK